MGGKCVKQSKRSPNKDLHFAALNGLDNWILDLVREGADVNCRRPRGETPLIVATAGGCTKFMEVLIEHGADVNAVVNNLQFSYDSNSTAPGNQRPIRKMHGTADNSRS